MTAKIIPFPSGRRARVAPVVDSEFPSPAEQQLLEVMELEETGTRPHWTGWDEYLFEHFLRQGLDVLSAWKKVEHQITLRIGTVYSEDWLLRAAREAVRSAEKLEH
ncbi:hypothetical protein GCM10007862_07130 [Dyella lipolytica]|uniref:Uncharacterized protein n=1 Tax=Dyella lipolytica TaxID=1867835 RepID=A0ABW8IYF6_9GAMM|nr:hypothetical protein [Dyella lipolytica]GLQ45662.1 hypothetical protein GCM10007862_07130 [Dyella lipolytica]